MKPFIRLPLLVIATSTLAGCNGPRVTSPPIQAKVQSTTTPKTTPTKLPKNKQVEVTIQALPNGMKSTITSSYPVDANAKSTVDVDWNGYGFIVTDNGRTLGRYSYSLAPNNQTAHFKIVKKVTISEDFYTATDVTGSDNAAVKRGVKARF